MFGCEVEHLVLISLREDFGVTSLIIMQLN